MEELVECMGDRMKLSEGERNGIAITEVDTANLRARGERCLLGKLMSDRRIQKEAFKALMSKLWKTLESVNFKEIHDNLWLLEFANMADKRRVKEGRPWLFDRSILVLKEVDESVPPVQMDFSKALFWIQVHDMPLTCMNREVGNRIGQSIGMVEEIDVTGDGVGWGRCLRIRVHIDITKPLERGRALVLNGKSVWVSFRYEKLPQFCYSCGRIYHAGQPCMNKTSHRLNDNDSVKPWGAWLRANDQRTAKEVLPRASWSEISTSMKTISSQDLAATGSGAERPPPTIAACTSAEGKEGVEQKSREVPSDKSSKGSTEMPATQLMVDYMDITAEETRGEVNETSGATCKEKDKEWGAMHQIWDVTGSPGHDPMVAPDIKKMSNCIEPCVEDPTLNGEDHMVGELDVTRKQTDHVAEKETCSANGALVQNGPQKEVAFTQPSNKGVEFLPTGSVSVVSSADLTLAQGESQLSKEEVSKDGGKTRKWKRLAKEQTADSVQTVNRKRKIEDEEGEADVSQKTQTKRSKGRGDAPNQLAMAVADPQPRLPQ
jgi:hypothetical protein